MPRLAAAIPDTASAARLHEEITDELLVPLRHCWHTAARTAAAVRDSQQSRPSNEAPWLARTRNRPARAVTWSDWRLIGPRVDLREDARTGTSRLTFAGPSGTPWAANYAARPWRAPVFQLIGELHGKFCGHDGMEYRARRMGRHRRGLPRADNCLTLVLFQVCGSIGVAT